MAKKDWGFDLFVATQVNHATSLRNFIETFLQLCLVKSSAELWCSGSSMAVFHASHPNCFQWFIKVHSKLHPLRYFHMQPGYQNCQPKPPIQTIDHWWPLVDNADSMFASAVVQTWRLHQWMQVHVPIDDKLWDFDLFLCSLRSNKTHHTHLCQHLWISLVVFPDKLHDFWHFKDHLHSRAQWSTRGSQDLLRRHPLQRWSRCVETMKSVGLITSHWILHCPTLSGWWYTYPSEKYESVGIIISNTWKKIQTTNQLSILGWYLWPIHDPIWQESPFESP